MSDVSIVILAGGQGARMGGNKAMRLLQGRPLIEWVFNAVSPQGAETLINANDNPAAYSALGRVIADLAPDRAGPLAGLQAGLHLASRDWVASVPCDTPFLPADLIARLYAAAIVSGADASVAVAGDKRQPAVALYHKRVSPQLDAFLVRGGRRVGEWLDCLQVVEVAFENTAAFSNINTPDDLLKINKILDTHG